MESNGMNRGFDNMESAICVIVRRLAGCLSLLFCLATSIQVYGDSVDLFDGMSLDGWHGAKESVWRVRDGAIVGGSMDGNPHNEYLATVKKYQNFRLTFEYKLVGNEGFVNGGVQFRSKWSGEGTRSMSGYQADIGAGYTGSLYDEHRRNNFLAKADSALIGRLEKPGEWNRYEVVATGRQIVLSVNGRRTSIWVEHDTSVPDSGVIALQIHGDCKAEISFRNITLEELEVSPVPGSEEIFSRFGLGQPRDPIPPFNQGRFDIHENEVIAFIGQENFVREQRAGELESWILSHWHEKNPVIRPMAWEADTVYEQWRDLNFGEWEQQLEAAGITMIIAQYGQMEALDGVGRLPEFIAAYHHLLDKFATRTRRLVLVSPMPFEKPVAIHAPDLRLRNSDVEAYVEAVRDIANQRSAIFVDLFSDNDPDSSATRLRITDNGIHLNATGLAVIGRRIASGLGIETADSPSGIRERMTPWIIRKNQLWFDCWRPANWSFVYGDRVNQRYGKAGGDQPSLQKAFENQLPLVEEVDNKIIALARGESIKSPEAVKPVLDANPPEALSPEEQMETFTLAEGFRVNLFASEAMGVVNPVQFSWDERGRLYVACSPSYPQSLASAEPADYILVLEDTDGDGEADKWWKYADKLTMVQGVEPGPGGIYVCDFDKLLFMSDLDGDGREDRRDILFSGFGIGDTHQLINSISHGPDGSLWFTQGLHAMSRVETPWGIARLDRSAVWRLRPKSMRLEGFFGGGMAGMNCWGVAFDDYGQVFHKSGDRPQGYWTVPGMVRGASPSHTSHDKISNYSYEVTPDQYHPVGPLFQTSPKTTSLDIVGTMAMPESIQGTALIGGYFGAVAELHRFHDNGAGFRTTQLPKLMRSSNKAFRPVDVSVGPDGSMYLADWYNPVIGHYQASYADPKRDKSHGRIWRISHDNYPPVKQPDLGSMSAAELLQQLKSSERWTRYQAKRLLFNMPEKSVTAAADQHLSSVEPDTELIELSGVFEAHEAPRAGIVSRLTGSKDPRVRSYGMRVAGMWGDRLEGMHRVLIKGAADSHPRVRLEAVIAATYLGTPKAVLITVEALGHPSDPFLVYAIRQSARALKPYWEEAFSSGQIKPGKSHQVDYLKSILEDGPAVISPGEQVYRNACLACHQPLGEGLPGVYPPLKGSEWVTEKSPDRLIKVVLHGLSGPIKVGGKEWGHLPGAIPMPALGGLSNKQIADVLTWIRKDFGNNSPAVSQESVAKVRKATSSRSTPWTAKELSGAAENAE